MSYNVPVHLIGMRDETENKTGKKPCPFEAFILVLKTKLTNIRYGREGSDLLAHVTGVSASHFCVVLDNHANLSDM